MTCVLVIGGTLSNRGGAVPGRGLAAAGGAGDAVHVPLREAATGERGADPEDLRAGDGECLAFGAGAVAVDGGAPAGV